MYESQQLEGENLSTKQIQAYKTISDDVSNYTYPTVEDYDKTVKRYIDALYFEAEKTEINGPRMTSIYKDQE